MYCYTQVVAALCFLLFFRGQKVHLWTPGEMIPDSHVQKSSLLLCRCTCLANWLLWYTHVVLVKVVQSPFVIGITDSIIAARSDSAASEAMQTFPASKGQALVALGQAEGSLPLVGHHLHVLGRIIVPNRWKQWGMLLAELVHPEEWKILVRR